MAGSSGRNGNRAGARRVCGDHSPGKSRRGLTDTVGPGGRALAVDVKVRTSNLNRLRRIEGQIRGIARMVEQDRYCADILIQITAVQKSLESIARQLLDNHVKHCITGAISAGGARADTARTELLRLVAHINR